MFRLVSSTILLIAFAVQTFYTGGIVASYYLNKEAYAKNCENKNKPVLKCNGKCQMAKKVQQEEKKEQQNTERKENRKNEIISSKSAYSLLPFSSSIQQSFPSILSMGKTVEISSSLFRPPIC